MTGTRKLHHLPRQIIPWVTVSLLFAAGIARAADVAEVQRGLLAGNYAAVIKQANGELRDAPGNSEWSMLLVQALLVGSEISNRGAQHDDIQVDKLLICLFLNSLLLLVIML